MKILLGHDAASGDKIHVPKRSFDTHWHLIGGTGKGKTTAIHTLLHSMLTDPSANDCWFIVDRMGNLSFELLLWATSDFCTEDVLERIVYIEPAREDDILGFNPLVYSTPQHGYYKVGRATDCILRAWQSQNINEMPRLARWVFNSFWAAAQMGLTVADCGHLLNPGSGYHLPLMRALPPMLQAEWAEILRSQGRATEILDSSRNRLKPFFEAPVLRRMFGTSHNHMDVHRFMREGKIVILNLAGQNRISPQLADAIGGLVINEVLATARGLPPEGRRPTYLLLDEFQRFVGPDIEEALPEVRQLKLKLILAHQSFAQLKRGDLDLTSMIFQAQSRLIFGLAGEDAEILGEELASLHYDPMKIKDEIRQRRQRICGHSIRRLASQSDTASDAKSWNESWGEGWKSGEGRRERPDGPDEKSESKGRDQTSGGGSGGGSSNSTSSGWHESLVPEFEEYMELASRTYATFEEDKRVWGRDLRRLKTGHAFLRLVDDDRVRSVKVKRSAAGYLGLSIEQLREDFPEVLDAVDRFKDANFASGLFMSAADIDRETEERLRRVLMPPINVQNLPAVTARPEAVIVDDHSVVLDDGFAVLIHLFHRIFHGHVTVLFDLLKNPPKIVALFGIDTDGLSVAVPQIVALASDLFVEQLAELVVHVERCELRIGADLILEAPVFGVKVADEFVVFGSRHAPIVRRPSETRKKKIPSKNT